MRVWMDFWGLSSPWAVLSICVSLSRSPQKRPTQTNDIIRLPLPLQEEKLWAELCLAFCLVSLQTPSSRSLVKQGLNGPLCTAVLSQVILREITVLARQQSIEIHHTYFYSASTKQFSAISDSQKSWATTTFVVLEMFPFFVLYFTNGKYKKYVHRM